MADIPNEECKPGSIVSLVTGIFRDASTLITKELTAAKLELREELANAKSTAALMGVGLGALLIGVILLTLMLVYLLQEYAGLDLWACYGIVGGAITVAGLAILLFGKQRAAKTSLVPTASIENAKEDARWITRKVKYDTK
ncbi:MAG TPA: phage holin family protein [Candidatus Binatia bacterium]|jgi:F0F1-type ATP synthase assembly protein I